MRTHPRVLKIASGVNLALWPLFAPITSKPRGETPIISRNSFSVTHLFFIVFVLFAFFYHPATGQAATMQDVENFLAANPAPTGCNNWTETITTGSSEVVKVWRRCAGNTIAYSENYWGGSARNPNASPCHTYACDGSGTTLSHNYWWTGACLDPAVNAVIMDSYWSVRHYCDGRIETTPVQNVNTCWGGDVGLGCTYIASSPCLFSTIGSQNINSPQCRSYDTLLAEFIITCDLKITSFTSDRTIIDPAIGERVTFSGAMTETTGQSVSWTVTLTDSSGASLRTWSGSGTSASANWDGKYASGSLADDGNYTALLEAQTEDGECLQTAAAQVVVKSSCGDIMLSANPSEVRPASTGQGDRTKADISIRLSKPAPSRGCEVNLRIEPADGTGGHSHDGNRQAHTGSVNPNFALFVEGETELHVEYTGGEVAGTEKIIAELLDENGNVQSTRNISIDVKVPDLRPLGSSEYYVLTGDRPAHPSNHYGQFWTNWMIENIAFDYWYETETKLGVNDMSLIWGGLFDVGNNWSSSPGHITHRTGENVDIDRCASGVLVKQLLLDRMARRNGGVRIIEEAIEPPPCQGPDDTARIHYGFQ